MKIWWCEEHKASGDADGESCWFGEEYEGGMHCRMVEMRLVSLDALVVEKVGGKWPGWATRSPFVSPQVLNLLFWAAAKVSDEDTYAEDGEPPKDPWDYDP